MCAVDVQEACARESARGDLVWHAAAYAVEFGVIEKVEVFPAEIHSRSFGKCKRLEEAEIKVDPARQVEGVAPHVAEREARRNVERRRIVEKRSRHAGVLICAETGMGVADLIGARTGAYAIAHARIVPVGCTVSHTKGSPGGNGRDAGHLPAA